MKDNRWIKGAILLGLSFFIAIFIVKPVGVSTQFSVVSGIIYNAIDEDIITEDSSRESGYKSSNAYFDKNEGKLAGEIKNPLNYGFIFVLAIPLGSFLGYVLRRNNKKEESFKVINKKVCVFEKTSIREYVVSFIGGFILLFGARMADGCTSGHMMSGMMQSSISGYIFAFAVFGTAIPTSLLVKKLRKNR